MAILGRCIRITKFLENGMMNQKARYSLSIMLLSLCGCTFAVGLKRTDIDKWSTRKFDDLGIAVEMPRKAALVEVLGRRRVENPDSWMTLSFNLHSVSSGRFLAEPLYLAQFSFERLSKEQYQSFRKGKQFLSYYWIWKDHHKSEYTNFEIFVWRDLGRDVQGWRRDYPCSNGDVIVAGVEYIPYAENEPFRTSDLEAIERVLNSVSELE